MCCALGKQRKRLVLGCLLISVVVLPNGPAWHQPVIAAGFNRANTSRETRLESIASIPFDKLTNEMQEKLSEVVNKPSIFRRMVAPTISCDPQMHLFLVRYPEVVVNIWHLLGITNVTVKRTGTYTFDAADGAGTTGSVQLVYGTPEIHILFADATYNGHRLASPLRVKCVFFLKSKFTRGEDGKLYVSDELDAFIQVEHKGIDFLAKAFHPLFGRTADNNFRESIKFLSRISQMAEKNGPAMQRLAAQLTKIDPAVQREFASISSSASRHAGNKTSRLPASNPRGNVKPAAVENLAQTIFTRSSSLEKKRKSSWMSR